MIENIKSLLSLQMGYAHHKNVPDQKCTSQEEKI